MKAGDSMTLLPMDSVIAAYVAEGSNAASEIDKTRSRFGRGRGELLITIGDAYWGDKHKIPVNSVNASVTKAIYRICNILHIFWIDYERGTQK